MAVTVSQKKTALLGTVTLRVVDVQLDSSYPTGGYSLPASALGLRTLIAVFPDAVRVTAGAGAGHYDAVFDDVNNKLMCYQPSTNTGSAGQVANATNLSTYSVRLVCFGTGL